MAGNVGLCGDAENGMPLRRGKGLNRGGFGWGWWGGRGGGVLTAEKEGGGEERVRGSLLL